MNFSCLVLLISVFGSLGFDLICCVVDFVGWFGGFWVFVGVRIGCVGIWVFVWSLEFCSFRVCLVWTCCVMVWV